MSEEWGQVNLCWDEMVMQVLEMLSRRTIPPEMAESWLWSLVEFADATYG